VILREDEIRSVTKLILFDQILIPMDKMLLGVEVSPHFFEAATPKSKCINEILPIHNLKDGGSIVAGATGGIWRTILLEVKLILRCRIEFQID